MLSWQRMVILMYLGRFWREVVKRAPGLTGMQNLCCLGADHRPLGAFQTKTPQQRRSGPDVCRMSVDFEFKKEIPVKSDPGGHAFHGDWRQEINRGRTR